MRILLLTICLLGLFKQNDSAGTEYVNRDSIECGASDISFTLTLDPSKSDLFAETGLNVDIFTGSPFIPVHNFKADTGDVRIGYKDYSIVATVAYGHDQLPLLYNIQQPFLAVPRSGGPYRNYTFSVQCTIPASYDVNVDMNTTDSGGGDSPGEIVTPDEHVENKISGLNEDGSALLGNQLTYIIELKDNTYAALLPVKCKYYNPDNEDNVMLFVNGKCPSPLPDDPKAPFYSKMERKSPQQYQLNFKAFTFEASPYAFLGIDCDILLCIEQNFEDCIQSCWGGGITTRAPAPTTAVITERPAPPPAVTTERPAPPPAVTTEQEPTEITTATEAVSVRFLLSAQFGDSLDDNKDEPQSETVNEKIRFKVNIPGMSPDTPKQESICANTQLVNTLYGVIGALAVLTTVLVLTLVFLLCTSRRKVQDNSLYSGRYPY